MELRINNVLYKTDADYTVFQFCSKLGINIPCFCYHEKLSIAGNCRMCLVQTNPDANLTLACTTRLAPGFNIFTENLRVRRARESVMEFLLINHPLDCPVCDQGGECDLQDLCFTNGSDMGRTVKYSKRAIDNLNSVGPLVKTLMTRCIHCTRCIRYLNLVCGDDDFVLGGRGRATEISAYIHKHYQNEMSANIIDLCPVGALTSMAYTFEGRPWESRSHYGVDILDSVMASIRIDVVNNSIMRILPIANESINEEWLTNKSRFAYDSLSVQRYSTPLLNLHNRYLSTSWKIALILTSSYLYLFRKYLTEVICGDYINVETVVYLRDSINTLGYGNFIHPGFKGISNDHRCFYIMNDTLDVLECKFNFIFVGLNPRMELPLLNWRIRKAFLHSTKFNAYSLGLSLNHTTFPIHNVGSTIFKTINFWSGKTYLQKLFLHNDFLNTCFFNVNTQELYVLSGVNCLPHGSNFHTSSLSFMPKFKLNVVNVSPSIVNYAETVSCQPLKLQSYGKRVPKKLLYVLGADYDAKSRFSDFVVAQSNFIPGSSNSPNILLPSSAYTETLSNYINLEGRVRTTSRAIVPARGIRTDFAIARAISLYHKLLVKPFHTDYRKLYDFLFRAENMGWKHFYSFHNAFSGTLRSGIDCPRVIANIPYNSKSRDYYSSDIFSRNSRIMALCSMRVKLSNLFVS